MRVVDSSMPVECQFLILERPHTLQPIRFQQSCSSQSAAARRINLELEESVEMKNRIGGCFLVGICFRMSPIAALTRILFWGAEWGQHWWVQFKHSEGCNMSYGALEVHALSTQFLMRSCVHILRHLHSTREPGLTSQCLASLMSCGWMGSNLTSISSFQHRKAFLRQL